MNKLYKSLVYDRQVSLSVLDTRELVGDAVKIHNLNACSAKVFGGLLTVCAYMSGCLKSDKGAVSITLKSGSGDLTASVSGDKEGRIRGFIDGAGDLKGGTMTVIKDDGFFRPFNGVCELVSDDISENFTHYFYSSEQIDTAVAVGVEMQGKKCVAAGGVVMQLLPGTSEENALRAENVMQNFADVTRVLQELGADGIMEKFFADETEKNGTFLTFPAYKCNCSRKKIEGIILSLGKEECLKILKDEGRIGVHCHYCNKDYTFDAGDIDRLFK